MSELLAGYRQDEIIEAILKTEKMKQDVILFEMLKPTIESWGKGWRCFYGRPDSGHCIKGSGKTAEKAVADFLRVYRSCRPKV